MGDFINKRTPEEIVRLVFYARLEDKWAVV